VGRHGIDSFSRYRLCLVLIYSINAKSWQLKNFTIKTYAMSCELSQKKRFVVDQLKNSAVRVGSPAKVFALLLINQAHWMNKDY